MIYVVAELRLKPGIAEKAAAEARKVVAGTVKEDGCLRLRFSPQRERSDRLVAVERWSLAPRRSTRTCTRRIWRPGARPAPNSSSSAMSQIITPDKVDKRT